MVQAVNAAVVQASVHGAGDRALDMLLATFAKLPDPARLRHRLEHAGYRCMTPKRIGRIRDLGLVPMMTMPFLSSFSDPLSANLGERADGAFAPRRLLDAGLHVPGSFDSLGAQPESLSPWFGMWCAVQRETFLGCQLAPEEAVTPAESLRSYATDAAWADWAEARKGSLEPGKLADLIVCGEDPVTLPPERLRDFQPEATILGGRVVSGTLP